MASGGDELSVPEGNDITISPQDISRRVTAGEYILKNAKGTRAWEQFRIVFDRWRPPRTLKVYLYKIQILLFSDHLLGIGI